MNKSQIQNKYEALLFSQALRQIEEEMDASFYTSAQMPLLHLKCAIALAKPDIAARDAEILKNIQEDSSEKQLGLLLADSFLSREETYSSWLEKEIENPRDDIQRQFQYALSLWSAERGDIALAARQLQPLFAWAMKGEFENEQQLRLAINIFMSKADFSTCQEKEPQAERIYKKAIDLCDKLQLTSAYPFIRKSMLYHNLADLYEQMEDSSQTSKTYSLAMNAMKDALEYEADDINGYLCTLYNSAGNFYANIGYFEQARSSFETSLEILEDEPEGFVNPQALKAKTKFYLGLLETYQNHLDKAKDYLVQAYQLQDELCEKNLEKPLERARTAYYLAQILDSPDIIEMYADLALQEFIRQWQKDPSFYLGAVADLYNSIGLCRMSRSDRQGQEDFEHALEWYDKARKEYPEMQDLDFSIAAVHLNLLLAAAMEENSAQEKQELDAVLECARQSLQQDLSLFADWLTLFTRVNVILVSEAQTFFSEFIDQTQAMFLSLPLAPRQKQVLEVWVKESKKITPENKA